MSAGIGFVAGLAFPQTGFAADIPSPLRSVPLTVASANAAAPLQRADFSGEAASAQARQVADWVVASRDNRGLSFLIVDKANARLFLFDPLGSVRVAAPVLLGLARGDDSPPGIGDRKLSSIKPAERITPAGRFVATPGENLSGQDILWLDYDAAISLHRATDLKPGLTREDRLARLASATTLDNRISHGCINVSVEFYDTFIRSTFGAAQGVVYVLPETRSVRDVFHIPAANRQAELPASTVALAG